MSSRRTSSFAAFPSLGASSRVTSRPEERRGTDGGTNGARGGSETRFLMRQETKAAGKMFVVGEHLHRKMGTFVSWRICALHLARRSSVRRRREGARALSRSIGVFIKTHTLLQQQLAGFFFPLFLLRVPGTAARYYVGTLRSLPVLAPSSPSSACTARSSPSGGSCASARAYPSGSRPGRTRSSRPPRCRSRSGQSRTRSAP